MLKFWPMAVFAIALVGCANVAQDTAPPGNLNGYWKSAYGDGFEISGTVFKQYDDASKAVSFAGTIVNAPVLTAASGGITVQITDAGSWGKTVGKFLVVRWKALAGSGVLEATPYLDGNSSESGVDTAVAAESLFTVAHGYYAMFAEYQRQ